MVNLAYLFQVEVFWIVKLCSVVVGYQRFRGPHCLFIQGKVAQMGKNDTDMCVSKSFWTGCPEQKLQMV